MCLASVPLLSCVAPAAGVVGGFAGGERGVQQFIDEGEVKIADKGESIDRTCAGFHPRAVRPNIVPLVPFQVISSSAALLILSHVNQELM